VPIKSLRFWEENAREMTKKVIDCHFSYKTLDALVREPMEGIPSRELGKF
jgi:hypothetical protein